MVIKNSYAAASGGSGVIVLANDAMQGETAKFTMAGLGEKFVATDTYPVLKSFTENNDNALGTPPFDGEGTEADPYLITNSADLYNMVALGGQGKYYKLTNDIYVNDVNAVNWKTATVNEGYTPTQWFASELESGQGYKGYLSTSMSFSGTIDGDGYAVHGIYYEFGNDFTTVAFIPYAMKVTIKNLGIEDSFIGGGRFTGGFVGYTPKTASVTITNCYIDDSCAVWGWNAGANYVDSDSDIAYKGEGDKLCAGQVTFTYKESATGTYVKSGDTYHAFTAADYEGTKYVKNDDETYTEDEKGTYLLDGETYREITVDDYTGTRYAIDDYVWTNAYFTSSGLGGIIGRIESKSTLTVSNCYATANVVAKEVKLFGFNSQGVTWAKEGNNGTYSSHVGGIVGDDWDATVDASNCFSIIIPHENNIGSKLYTLATGINDGRVSVSSATGATALDKMDALDKSVWYAVKVDGKYPKLRLRGTVIGDVNEDGVFEAASDAAALRVVIMDETAVSNGDFNRNATVDVCDLVALVK